MNLSKILALCVLGSFSLPVRAQNLVPKTRAESFFGLHFDFHATQNDSQIGATLTLQMVNTLLDQVKPDYIQVDTKGHPGISSYPTKVGVAARGLVKDPLKIFRQATASRGVGLYSHFSGVLDIEAVKNHPDWARVNANGQPDGSATSIFGAYCDSYFIPQLEELSKTYGINGVWVDGDCWAVQADFSKNAKEAYTMATGKQAALNTDYMQFTRNAFHKYLAHYTAVLHRFNPHFQIASNWAFSSYMPGRIDAGVDFLSGDVTNDATNLLEFEPRVMGNEAKPWDLMEWGFMGDKNGQGHFWKSARMLEQKGAIIISQGGGYQVYISQNRDASIPLSPVPVLKEVAAFCRARKPYCFKAVPIPQIAMLFSESGHNFDLGTNTAFNQNNGGNDNIKGTMAMLLNAQYSVGILQEFNLNQQLARYPLLVITEWNYLNPEAVTQIENYVFKGGKVLLIGGVTCNLFSKMLPQQAPANNNNPAGLTVKSNKYGQGVVVGVNNNISLSYLNTGDNHIAQTVVSLVRELFPNPMVTVSGSNAVHVTLNTLRHETLIHLVNAGDNLKVLANNQLEFVLPPVGPLTVRYKSDKKPAQVLLQPGNIPLSYTYNNGFANIKVPGVDVYSIIEVK